ncbi:GNAT family N-acetyltransferase [Azospirillum sp. SYSU D00513]|uniref:GNAT family N-acetyltransferase n=1 Tax=Azospirillum sp. SYSU D00513 TaxID=2812561 RepID=UPI001A96DAFF|nr:GNAT family N-acetyltransferase [Azospirillum sp. SYSU D00513]
MRNPASTIAATAIRPYETADHAECLAVWLSASRTGHPFLSEADLAEQKPLVADLYLPSAENWVAMGTDGRLLGFIGLLDTGTHAHIGGLFVDPRAHGRGVGRALVEHAAALKGVLTVEVYESNGAVRFYERCGFRPTGRRERDDQGRALPLLTLFRDAPL